MISLWNALRRILAVPPLPADPEAHQARMDAERRLAEAQAQGPAVKAAADQLRELRRRNHFGPMIAKALGEK